MCVCVYTCVCVFSKTKHRRIILHRNVLNIFFSFCSKEPDQQTWEPPPRTTWTQIKPTTLRLCSREPGRSKRYGFFLYTILVEECLSFLPSSGCRFYASVRKSVYVFEDVFFRHSSKSQNFRRFVCETCSENSHLSHRNRKTKKMTTSTGASTTTRSTLSRRTLRPGTPPAAWSGQISGSYLSLSITEGTQFSVKQGPVLFCARVVSVQWRTIPVAAVLNSKHC